jgi:phosphate uptake regulator
MENRKLIKLGNSSFAVALPKEWVDKSGLKKGDDVFIERNGNGELTIASNRVNSKDNKSVDVNLQNKDEDFIKRKLHALYIQGYSTINIKGDARVKKKIKELIKDYLSLEIVDSNESGIIVKDYFDIRESRFEHFVRKIDTCLREMFDIVLDSIKKDKIDSGSIKELVEIDKSVNKFYFLCSRIFVEGIDNPSILNLFRMDGSKLFGNWWTSFNLESLGDQLKYILNDTQKINSKQKEAVHLILSKLKEAYISSIESFYKENSEESLAVIQETMKIKLDIEKLEEDCNILRISYALDKIQKNVYQNAKMISYMKF